MKLQSPNGSVAELDLDKPVWRLGMFVFFQPHYGVQITDGHGLAKESYIATLKELADAGYKEV